MFLKDQRPGLSKQILILFITVSIIVIAIAAQYSGRQGDPQDANTGLNATFIPAPTVLSPGLYLLGALEPSVAYVVETTEGLILVDTGLEDSNALIRDQFAALNLDINDLKFILLTHGHGDHYLGARELQRQTGAKIHVGKRDSDVLRDAGPRPAVFSTFEMDHVSIHVTPVDVELIGGEIITLGDASIRAIATPGHTPGSICYLLEHNGLSVLFSGDTIMTMTGELGTYATYLAPQYRGNAIDYLATLRKLQKLPAPDLLLPGHPETNQGMISARISAEHWSLMLNQGLRDMEELTVRYAADGADFLDGHPKEILTGLHYLGDFSGAAVYCFERNSSIVLVDVPEAPEFISFLKARLEDIDLDLSMLAAVLLTSVSSESTAQLTSLISKTNCRLIAGKADDEFINSQKLNAVILPPESAGKEFDWLPLQAIPAEGFNRTRMVYEVMWEGKRVLLTGKVPLKLSPGISRELREASFQPQKFEQSLKRIMSSQPDVWLPGRPVNGQNANLYGSDWRNLNQQIRLSFGFGIL